MEEHGMKGFDEQQLDRKIRNLKASFIAIQKKNKSTGEGRTNWEFFEEMEAIFGGDLAVSGCRTLATLVTEEENILPMFYNENFETELHANCNNEDFSNENIYDENAFNVKSTSSGRRKRMANKERDSYYQKKINN
ncbi:hypothetical protein ACLKA7_001212 [Drosophila subpalustris]